jgi:hypothetical protein
VTVPDVEETPEEDVEYINRPHWWAEIGDLPSTLLSQVTVDAAADAIETASFIIGQLAGGLYRPINCVTEIYDTRVVLGQGSQPYPVFYNGQVFNCNGCSTCTCECAGCGITHRTRLRGTPVREVCGVWADGVPLEPNQYVLLDNAVLGFINGAPCDVHCLVARYYYGTGIPAGGRNAVLKLAEQLLISSMGGECKLPTRVTSISRQGLSWTLLDPQDFLKDGRTGIYEIDLLLRALNPAGALRRARVFNPDVPNGSVTQSAIGEPPFSSDVTTGMSIPSWEPTRAYTNSPKIMKAVFSGTPTYTVFDNTQYVYNPWLTADGVTAMLEIPAEIRDQLHDQTGYAVYNGITDNPIDQGWLRLV